MPGNKRKLTRRENLALRPYCRGRGVDVGCGGDKIHPDAIGIDLVPGGKKGSSGRQKGVISKADLRASGDDLSMFGNNELDYVVSSHNLEHYPDPVKTLKEWKRVLKPGGLLGVILPDDSRVDTMKLDPDHKHAFTPESFKILLLLVGGLEVIKLGECLSGRSFICVMRKRGKASLLRRG